MGDDAFTRIKNDPGLRALLKTARSWGVSPRRFLSQWEPARITVHFYEQGQLVRSVETVESEWDEESADLAVAYAMWESDQCPGCHQPMSETTLPEREALYVPGPAVRCHYCTASHMASELYAESPQAQALYVPVTFRGGNSEPNGTDTADMA